MHFARAPLFNEAVKSRVRERLQLVFGSSLVAVHAMRLFVAVLRHILIQQTINYEKEAGPTNLYSSAGKRKHATCAERMTYGDVPVEAEQNGHPDSGRLSHVSQRVDETDEVRTGGVQRRRIGFGQHAKEDTENY